MPRTTRKSGRRGSAARKNKYDAHHAVLENTYGALADLRRELADSKDDVAKRAELLNAFAVCEDSQRAWLLLEDYFEQLQLTRKDFASGDWWDRMMEAREEKRLEETAFLFLKSNRPLPSELMEHANFERFAELEEAEKEQVFVRELEDWILPPAPVHLDAPRASLSVVCAVEAREEQKELHELCIRFSLYRPRTGHRYRKVSEIVDLTTRATHEQELFSVEDWKVIEWIAAVLGPDNSQKEIRLHGAELLTWISQWGRSDRLMLAEENRPLRFQGQLIALKPHLKDLDGELTIVHRLAFPNGEERDVRDCQYFYGLPSLALAGDTFYLLNDPPPPALLDFWKENAGFPIRKLSHRLLTSLRNNRGENGEDWTQLCVTHAARPQFVFELEEDTVRLRLTATSERDQSRWQWSGHEWIKLMENGATNGKPEILDDARLDPAVAWLRRLDWFTPEPGVWVGDANENFLNVLAAAWPERPSEAEFLGNTGFQRLFLSPRRLRPKLVMHGSGIDWLSVSAAWEQEGMRLTPADLERLQTATGRFVKLPNSGWVELDQQAVRAAQETMADLGLDQLSMDPQRVDMIHAAQLKEESLEQFGETSHVKALRKRLDNFSGMKATELPSAVRADLRPYQKEGFHFLCHLSRIKLGGILADDMGLGKTLQTLTWLAWLHEKSGKRKRPALVICPASVLHNWRREAQKFTPHLKVLVLESGAARHNLRKQIPENDLIVTNYALLRRDLEALQKFSFNAVILDEAQFIKNPGAQVTLSVKQLKADRRLALTGTPLENRLLDLWSIVDFIQPGYLGTQSDFQEKYEPKGEDADFARKVARKRLSAKLRPLLKRRLKKQVAKDLPDRIEERRDCELTEDQRLLYLAELRRSREQVMKAIHEKGVGKSKMHVLAALTRLRQICCHPQLVGNDSPSGKTDTLMEILEPLIDENQKVLVFSQFVQMLRILEVELKKREVVTRLLTGETKNRQEVVNAFQNDDTPGVFLLSLRAAGTGLNLTNASYVVLYDPWWNPAVEAQAIDRSHRIGQTQTVNAYRLISPGTVEEKIWDLQQTKSQTISDVLGEEGFARSLSQTDLEYLFSED